MVMEILFKGPGKVMEGHGKVMGRSWEGHVHHGTVLELHWSPCVRGMLSDHRPNL